MASVHSSRAAKYARRGLPEDEAPEHVPSAGELLIKHLAHKQMDTKLSLEEQLKDEKKFVPGIGLVEEFSTGTTSLQEFEKRQDRAEKIEELKGRGLTKSEAEAVLSGSTHNKASPAALAASQLHIQKQLQSLSPLRCEGSVSRSEWEMAASVKPDSLETRMYKFAMQNTKVTDHTSLLLPGHPVHGLVDMEKLLLTMAGADPQKTAKTVRRKRRQLLDAMGEPASVHYKPPEPNSSLWDCIEPPVIVHQRPTKPARVATCRKQNLYTIRDGQIVPVDKAGGIAEKNVGNNEEKANGQPFVALEPPCSEPKVQGKVSEEEIKRLPRFEKYERGTVSKILYIKNLSSSVTESDLVALFSKYEELNEEKIIYRLMNGKMRGQAFVTFKSCEVATKALEGINGTVLHRKPVVIQYGRQQT